MFEQLEDGYLLVFGHQVSVLLIGFCLAIFIGGWAILFPSKDTRLTAEEKMVSGLSGLTDPRFYRVLLTMIVVIPVTVLIPGLRKAGLPYFWSVALYAILFYICFLIVTRLGGKNAEQKWLDEDKIERQKNVAEAKQKQLINDEEARVRQVEADNARYAALGNRTASPTEISETARRVADELKKG